MAQDRNEPSLEEILASIKKVIAEDGRPDRLARRPAAPVVVAANSDDDVLELTDPLETSATVAANANAPMSSGSDAAPDRLISEPGEQVMRDSLAMLATLSEPGAPPPASRSGETSLEDMVRDMMRPMLAAWLDKHLPGLVEQMVAREISRITGRKG